MARLILTDEEKETENYLDWKDEDVGKLVRHLTHKFGALLEEGEKTSIHIVTLAQMLCRHVAEMNSADTKLTLENISDKETGREYGDWTITIRNETTVENVNGDDDSPYLQEMKMAQNEDGSFEVELLVWDRQNDIKESG